MSMDDYAEMHGLIDRLTPEKARLAASLLRALAADAGDRGGNFGQVLGVRFTEFAASGCACEAEVGEPHWNPHGIVHGAVPFALLDWAMGGAVTAAGLQPGERPVTLDVQTRFHRALRRGRLAARARVVERSDRIATLAADVTGDDGRRVASATGAFYLYKK